MTTSDGSAMTTSEIELWWQRLEPRTRQRLKDSADDRSVPADLTWQLVDANPRSVLDIGVVSDAEVDAGEPTPASLAPEVHQWLVDTNPSAD